MSLTVSITPTTVEMAPAKVITTGSQLSIIEIIDNPINRTVTVKVEDLGIIELTQLSGSNYGEWTKAKIKTQLKNQLTA